MNKIFISLLLATVLLTGSKCNDDTVNHSVRCNEIGFVKDYTGLDACGLIIIKDNGEKLEPAMLADGIELIPDTKIKFAYEELDMASACMVGKTVKITCLEELGPVSACPDFTYGDLSTVTLPEYTLIKHHFEGSVLHMNIGFSGCDDNRDFKLVVSRAQMKSLPPQNAAVLSFTPQACEAYFTKEICFDLKDLKAETILNLKVGDQVEKIHFKP